MIKKDVETMNGWNQLIIYNDQLYSSIRFLSKHTNVRTLKKKREKKEDAFVHH